MASKEEAIYSDERWELLRDMRRRSGDLLEALGTIDLVGYVHGSVARGDVRKGSDVDVVVFNSRASYKVELALEGGNFQIVKREIVMATPWQLPKAHIYLAGGEMVTFPLERPKKTEGDFYRFGGMIGLEDIMEDRRVPGVDKNLILIEPTEKGHRESRTIGKEGKTAKRVGVSQDIVRERVQVLTRRRKVGKTGIFLKRKISADESFESVWKRIREENSRIIRKG